MAVPPPPSTLTLPADYAFGDTIRAADSDVLRSAVAPLRARFGAPAEVKRYTTPRETDFAKLKTYYDAEAADAGWRPIPQFGRDLPVPGQALGYEADGAAFAVVWLAPRVDSPITPVNVIRFGN